MEEIINKFENGHERFNTDALFNKCIYALANGADPINLLDQVLKINFEQFEKMKELANKQPPPTIIIKEQE